MKILIRTDGGHLPILGTGHIKRTILLANELKKSVKLNFPKIIFVSQNKKCLGYYKEM